MRRINLTVFALLFWVFFSTTIHANVGFAQADYLRTLNRSASVGTVDAMFFNPSGTVRLPDGFYMDFGGDIGLSNRSIQFSPTGKVYGTGMYMLPASGSLGFIYKRAGSSFYVTLQPTFSEGINIKGVDLALGALGPSVRDYKDGFFNYQLTIGTAIAFNDVLAMNFGGNIISQNHSSKVKIGFGAGLVEDYSLNVNGVGGSLEIGMLITPTPWMAIAINVDTGGPMLTMQSGKSSLDGGPGTPSGLLGWPGDPAFVVRTSSARADVGLSFNLWDIGMVQLTGLVQFDLFNSTISGVSFDKDKISYTYGFGAGIDLGNEHFSWGLGVLYLNEMPGDLNFYNTIDAIRVIKMQSLVVGTGFKFGIGSHVDMAISGAYPIYFSSGSDGMKFFKIPNPAGGYLESSEFFISIGLTVKLPGLF